MQYHCGQASERISFSRNIYNGMFSGENVPTNASFWFAWTRAADPSSSGQEPDPKKSYPHEVFTSDGTGGAFAGPIVSSSGTSVDIGKKADASWVAGAMAVLSGPGAGQVRRIVNASGSSFIVDRPWDFQLTGRDSDIGASFITVVPYVGKVIMEGNLARNSTTMQVFGSGFDSIYAGNTLEFFFGNENCHPAGMWVMALYYGGGYQPNMFFEIIDNVLRDTQGMGIVIDGLDNLTLSMAHVVRGNTVIGKQAPPTEYGNALGAINVGQPDGVHTSQHFGNCLECIRSVVVEDNAVRLRRAENGTCAANAVVVHAAHTVARNNSCTMVP